MQGIGNIMTLIGMAKKSAKVESVYALLNIHSTNEDLLVVTAIFTSCTKTSFKKGLRSRPALLAGSVLTLSTPLPSVVQADPDMIFSFAENLSRNIRVEHDCKSGINVLLTAS
jgi:hypothetical protein